MAEAKVADEDIAFGGGNTEKGFDLVKVSTKEGINLPTDDPNNYTVLFPKNADLCVALEGYGPVIGNSSYYGAQKGDVVISINGVNVQKADKETLEKVKKEARAPLSVLIRPPPENLKLTEDGPKWNAFKLTEDGPVPLREFMQSNRTQVVHAPEGEGWGTTDPYDRMTLIQRAQKTNLKIAKKVVGITDLSKLAPKDFLAPGEEIVGALQGVACHASKFDPTWGPRSTWTKEQQETQREWSRKEADVGNVSFLLVKTPVVNQAAAEGTDTANAGPPRFSHRLLVYRESDCKMGYSVDEHFVQQNADRFKKSSKNDEKQEYPEFESMTKVGKYEATRSRNYTFEGYFCERQLCHVDFGGRAKVMATIQRTEKHFQALEVETGQGEGCCSCFNFCGPRKSEGGSCCSCFSCFSCCGNEDGPGTEFKGLHYSVRGQQDEHNLDNILKNEHSENLSEIEKVVRSTNVENMVSVVMKDLFGSEFTKLDIFLNPLTPPTAPLCFVSLMHSILGNSEMLKANLANDQKSSSTTMKVFGDSSSSGPQVPSVKSYAISAAFKQLWSKKNKILSTLPF